MDCMEYCALSNSQYEWAKETWPELITMREAVLQENLQCKWDLIIQEAMVERDNIDIKGDAHSYNTMVVRRWIRYDIPKTNKVTDTWYIIH